MRNRLLAITRNTVPYVKELRPYAGSVTACILMQQLEFWFDRKPEGFFKFLETSLQHDFYKEGDSWQEELGLSSDEFRTAFDKIGVRHKSKRLYEATDDAFDGKFYCSYHDKIKGITWYFRNHEKVDAVLNSLSDRPPEKAKLPISVNGQSQVTEMGNSKLRNEATPSYGDGDCQALPYTEITSEITLIDPEREKEDVDTDNRETRSLEPEPAIAQLPTPSSNTIDTDAASSFGAKANFSAAIIHPTKKMDDRFHRGGRLEVWEVAINEPDPVFLDWLVANDKCGNASLPPRTKAKRMLYNSRDRCDSLAADLWCEFQESDGRIEPVQTYADKRAMNTYNAGMAAIADL